MPFNLLHLAADMRTLPKRLFGLLFLLCGAIAVLIMAVTSMRSLDTISSSTIPLPFGSADNSSFRGSLTDLGTTSDNRKIVDMSFEDKDSELFGLNDLTFVLTPSDPDSFSKGAPLSVALTPAKKIYGYKYTSGDATEEIAMQALKNDPDNSIDYDYSELFPGIFFASPAALADKAFVDGFAAKGIVFTPLSVVTLEADARYLIIAEEEGISITVRGLTWCGDDIRNQDEQCDGSDLASETCQTRGANGGVLTCMSSGEVDQCTFDTRHCINDSCPTNTIGRPSAIAVLDNKIYVASTFSGTVVALDTTTRSVVATIPVGFGGNSVAAAGGKIYVANSMSDNVTVIDAATNTAVNTIAVGDGPVFIAIRNGKAYVANSLGNSVSVIDTTTDAVIKTYSVGGRPEHIAFAGNKAYIATVNATAVSVIDLTAERVLTPIPTGSAEWIYPFYIEVSGRYAYVAGRSSGHIFVIDTQTDAISGRIPLSNPSDEHIAVHVMNDRIYALGGFFNHTLSIVNASDWQDVSVVNLNGRPTDILFTDTKAYIPLWSSDAVDVVDLETNAVSSLQVGAGPMKIALAGTDAYVGNERGGSVSVIDTVTDHVFPVCGSAAACNNGVLDPGEDCEADDQCAVGNLCRGCRCAPVLEEEFFSDWVRYPSQGVLQGDPPAMTYAPAVDYKGELWSVGGGTKVLQDGVWQDIDDAPMLVDHAVAENGQVVVAVGGKGIDGRTILIKNSWENVFRSEGMLPETIDVNVSAVWFRGKFWVAGGREDPERDILVMRGNGSGSFLGDFSVVGEVYGQSGNMVSYTPPFVEQKGRLIVFANSLWFIGLEHVYSSADGNVWMTEADAPWYDASADLGSSTVLPFVWQGKLLVFHGKDTGIDGHDLYVADNGKEWHLAILPANLAGVAPTSIASHRNQLWIADRNTQDVPPEPTAWCGNGSIDAGEECDDQDLAGKTCLTEQLHGRQLRCHPSGTAEECTLDTALCTVLPETPAVTVSMLPAPGSSVPAGGQDVPVVRYRLAVRRTIALNALRLEVTSDDIHVVEGASLWLDTNRDGVLRRIAGWDRVSTQVFFNTQEVFGSLATLAPGTYTAEIRADICLHCTSTSFTLTPLSQGSFFYATEESVGPAIWDGTATPVTLAVTRGRCNNGITEPPEECDSMTGLSCQKAGMDGGMIWCTSCFVDTGICTWSGAPEAVAQLDTRALGSGNQVSPDFRPNSFKWNPTLKMYYLDKFGGNEVNGNREMPATGTIRGVSAGNFNVWIQWDAWPSSYDRTTQHIIELNGRRTIVNMTRPPRQSIPGQQGSWDLLGCVALDAPGYVELRVPAPLNPTASIYFDDSTVFPSKILLTRMTSDRGGCIADPIYRGDPPSPTVRTADIETPGQGAVNGTWKKHFSDDAMGGSYLEAARGGAGAFWRFTAMPKGVYDIYGTWQPITGGHYGDYVVEGGIFDDLGAYLSPYALRYDSGIAPSGVTDDGVIWQKLGTLVLTRTENVILTGRSFVPLAPLSADAMRLVPVE
jgi:YVTN family beta-propeller protein